MSTVTDDDVYAAFKRMSESLKVFFDGLGLEASVDENFMPDFVHMAIAAATLSSDCITLSGATRDQLTAAGQKFASDEKNIAPLPPLPPES